MSAAAVILIQMRKIINSFRDANATSPATAIIPSEHGIRLSVIFKRLVRDGILVPVNEERFYLDEERELQIQKRRRKVGVTVVIVLLIGILIMILTKR